VGEFLPHPSNPLYVPDGVTEGLPVLHGQEAHIGVPAIDWRGLDNPAEQAAVARNREAAAAAAAPKTPKVRSVKK
jgi:hypothetical protein